MKIMHCPLNGPRNIQEFVYGGEIRDTPADDAPDAAWADYVFLENNAATVVREWWMHIASGYWFIAERDTRTDHILRTYTAGNATRAGAETETV